MNGFVLLAVVAVAVWVTCIFIAETDDRIAAREALQARAGFVVLTHDPARTSPTFHEPSPGSPGSAGDEGPTTRRVAEAATGIPDTESSRAARGHLRLVSPPPHSVYDTQQLAISAGAEHGPAAAEGAPGRGRHPVRDHG